MRNFRVGDLIKHRLFGDVRVVVDQRTTPSGNIEFKLSGESYFVYATTIQKYFLLLSK